MITFYNANNSVLRNLKINDKTEIYVANNYNNILRQVKDINEALSLIGFHNYNGYKIPNVYAGFDTDSHKASIAGFDSAKETAKVIVFNVVSKDNDGDKYRVINSTGSNFSSTLEDVDGKLYDRNNVLNEVHFPLNYGDLLDVIEVRGDVIKTLLDHSDKKLFPVVKVAEIFDNDEVVVVDRYGNESKLNFGDADIFNAKQYKDLAKGDYLQFATTDKSRFVDVVSILEDTKDTRDLFNAAGSVLKVAPGVEANTAVGEVLSVSEESAPFTVELKIKEANWDADLNNKVMSFEIDKTNASNIKKLVMEKDQVRPGNEVVFKVDTLKGDNKLWAYDFKLNNPGLPRIDQADRLVKEAEAARKAKKNEVEAAAKLIKNKFNTVKEANAEKANIEKYEN